MGAAGCRASNSPPAAGGVTTVGPAAVPVYSSCESVPTTAELTPATRTRPSCLPPRTGCRDAVDLVPVAAATWLACAGVVAAAGGSYGETTGSVAFETASPAARDLPNNAMARTDNITTHNAAIRAHGCFIHGNSTPSSCFSATGEACRDNGIGNSRTRPPGVTGSGYMSMDSQ